MKTNFLSFEEYKQKKINEEFEASVNKINPYTGNVIRTVGDFNEYKENFNVVKYLDNKGMVNPYTNTEIKTYIEYKKYLELCLLNEYEECKKTFINNSNSIFSNKMAKSNTSTTNKKFSSFILIITSLFSSLLFFWWVLLAVYFLVLWIISNFEIRLSNTHLSLLITIAIYIFLVSYLVLKYDRLEYIDNLKSEITSLNNRLIISDNCYAKLKHAFENDYEEKSINLKKQYIEIGKSLEFEYKEKNKVLESDYKEKIRALEHEYNEKNKALEIDYKEKNKALEIDYKEKKNVLDKKESEVNLTKSYINNIINESSQKYPWLSTIYSDLFYSVDKQVAADLLLK